VGSEDTEHVWLEVIETLLVFDDDGESVVDAEAVLVSLGVLRCDTEGEKLSLCVLVSVLLSV
jgi:hypothetical protein